MNSDERACPYCGEAIKMVAIKCKHCKSTVEKFAPEKPDTNNQNISEVVENETKKVQKNENDSFKFEKDKKCPFCTKTINVDSEVCEFCNEKINNEVENKEVGIAKNNIKSKKLTSGLSFFGSKTIIAGLLSVLVLFRFAHNVSSSYFKKRQIKCDSAQVILKLNEVIKTQTELDFQVMNITTDSNEVYYKKCFANINFSDINEKIEIQYEVRMTDDKKNYTVSLL